MNHQNPLIALFRLRHLCIGLSLCIAGCNIEIQTQPSDRAALEISLVTGTNNATSSPPSAHPHQTSSTIRVMTYNIQNFTAEAATHGDRVEKLRNIIRDINPDVVALQEIDDRAALHLIFSPDQWHIIIDDDSRDRLDLAFAVRKPWVITNAPHDLDADDEHFLAPSAKVDTFFPVRRDALFVNIAAPDGTPAFTAINIHAKARVGGRANTSHRREGASRHLLKLLNDKLPGKNIVLMGDFNDGPDDLSLNILETGDPDTTAGTNTWPSTHLVNLHQPLWESGHVTIGADPDRIDPKTGKLNIRYPDAPARNARGRTNNTHTGPILFDQILVSPALAGNPPQPGYIYQDPQALTGPGFSRPSDHLPAFADITLPEN